MLTSKLKFLLALLALSVLGAWWFLGESVPRIDLDIPAVASDSAKTSDAVKAPSTAKPAPKSTRVLENGVYVHLISWTANGFDPAVVNAQKGEELRFTNKTTLTMRVAFENSAKPGDNSGLNQESTVGGGGTYQVKLNDAGTWSFYNLNSGKSKVGVLVVQ